jgi:hypothetical protein
MVMRKMGKLCRLDFDHGNNVIVKKMPITINSQTKYITVQIEITEEAVHIRFRTGN